MKFGYVDVMCYISFIEEICLFWGWVGFKFIEIVGENEFGNFIVKDEDGKYWCLCLEDCYCKIIVINCFEFDVLLID